MDILSLARTNGIVTPDILGEVERLVNEEGVSYEMAMIQSGMAAESVRTLFAEYYGVPALTFDDGTTLSQEVLSYVSEESARHYQIVPVRIEDGILIVACNDPDNLQVREVLSFVSQKYNLPYKLVFMLSSDIGKALSFYESLSGEVGVALGSLETELEEEILEREKESKKQKTEENHPDLKEDAPVTKIVATILRYAVDGSASDIHIEPGEEKVVVRFRVDGVLQKSLELPKNVRDAVVARVKILSSARLDEKRKPQDGRFSATFDGRKIDFRVSIFPTSHGEKVVMRILDNTRGVRTLEDTGVSPHHVDIIKRVLQEPYGIILISGPTGSGKSTTLYAMMDVVDKESKNVLSLEDPVEYNIPNVSQSQIRPEIGYTFAAGLRSTLRQDPDIIMVGEIRDKETAQLAIQAALTGHLVLSTIHTNDALSVVTRLVDMGIDPYLIAPTLKLAIAQRLSRRICPGTGAPVPVEGELKNMIDTTFSTLPEKYRSRIPKAETMLRPEPSAGCSSGTKGRVAVMETFEVTEEMRGLIQQGASADEMAKVARENGHMTLHEDAIIKALNHVIPYEEMGVFATKVGIEMEEAPVPTPAAVDNAGVPPLDNAPPTVDNPGSEPVIDV